MNQKLVCLLEVNKVRLTNKENLLKSMTPLNTFLDMFQLTIGVPGMFKFGNMSLQDHLMLKTLQQVCQLGLSLVKLQNPLKLIYLSKILSHQNIQMKKIILLMILNFLLILKHKRNPIRYLILTLNIYIGVLLNNWPTTL